MLLELPFSSDVSFVKRGIIERELKWEPGEKPPNLMRKTGKKNQRTNENILAL